MKYLTPILIALFTPLALAQQTPPLAGIAHAAIRVADLKASRDFYARLGFEEAFSVEKDGLATQSFIKINDRQFIELYPRLHPADPIGFMHVCFESDDIAALNTFYRDRGLAPNPVRKAGAGHLLFTMQGPENQNIEYTQYMPGSRHSNDIGLHLGPTRISTALTGTAFFMQDPAAAQSFYIDKLSFIPSIPLKPNSKTNSSSNPALWLGLPGISAQSITFIPPGLGSAFRMFFAVDNLAQTATRLETLAIPLSKTNTNVSIHDPDGNILVFVASARLPLPRP